MARKKNTEQLKSMSKDERAKYWSENKSEELAFDDLDAVNGGVVICCSEADKQVKNPGSAEIPFEGNWESSFGYVCDGEAVC